MLCFNQFVFLYLVIRKEQILWIFPLLKALLVNISDVHLPS